MLSLTAFRIRFTPNWLMTLLSMLAIALFMRLGFWQLTRADEKKQILSAQTAMSNQLSFFWQPGESLPASFQPVEVRGYFLATLFLLDNQHQNHQFGYNVITPLVLANDQIVLIDRGWVQGDITRKTLPSVSNPEGAIRLKGQIYYPSTKSMLLGQFMERKSTDVSIIETVDIKKISQFLHKPVYPFMIRLDKNEAHGFLREWQAVSMPPERHYAYAVQWFAMATVVLIIFIALNIKKKYEKSS